jgi:hypothetical protein
MLRSRVQLAHPISGKEVLRPARPLGVFLRLLGVLLRLEQVILHLVLVSPCLVGVILHLELVILCLARGQRAVFRLLDPRPSGAKRSRLLLFFPDPGLLADLGAQVI